MHETLFQNILHKFQIWSAVSNAPTNSKRYEVDFPDDVAEPTNHIGLNKTMSEFHHIPEKLFQL